jgi:hypothetical protein
MTVRQTISRISFVLPHISEDVSGADPNYSDPCQDMIVDALTRAVRVRGVQVERHQLGRTSHGGGRADLAIWFPMSDGRIPKLDRREISADFHAVYAVHLKADTERLLDFDQVLVHHSALQEPLDEIIADASTGDQKSTLMPLPLVLAKGTISDHEKTENGPVVMLDLRQDYEQHIERVVFQVALAKHELTPVFLVPHDSRSRHRLRTLCERHGVPGFMVSGPEAITDSLWQIDDFIGRPQWAELLVLALTETSCAYWDIESSTEDPVIADLLEQRAMGRVSGILQLAIALDRRVSDPGGLVAQGTVLKSKMIGDTKRFLDAAAQIHGQPAAQKRQNSWEPVGPKTESGSINAPSAVDARDQDSQSPDPGRGVEQALMDLKRKLGLSESTK